MNATTPPIETFVADHALSFAEIANVEQHCSAKHHARYLFIQEHLGHRGEYFTQFEPNWTPDPEER